MPTSFYLYCIGTSVCRTTSLFIVTPARLWYSNWYSEEQYMQQLLLAIAFPKDINMILWDTSEWNTTMVFQRVCINNYLNIRNTDTQHQRMKQPSQKQPKNYDNQRQQQWDNKTTPATTNNIRHRRSRRPKRRARRLRATERPGLGGILSLLWLRPSLHN